MAELNNTIVRGNLRVTSQAEIQEVIENGTSLANKYYLASNPNGYTSNTGTVTSVAVSMNGSVKGTVTTSGTIDLGTVITDVSGKLNKSGDTMTGTLNSRSILPTANNGYDLGSSSKMFSQIYSNYIRTNYVQALGSSLGVYAGNDTIGLYIDAANYNHRVVRFESDGGLPIGEMGSYTNGKEGNSDRVDYLRVGTAYSSHYGADGYSEIQLSCVGTGEGDTMDYVCIRPQGTSAGGIVYLPNVSGWSTVFLATTDQIPSVLPAQYVTSPPSSNNYTGVKFVLLDSSVYPASSVTKRDGYIYMWY